MDKAIMIEVENLRRASVAGLQGKYRELFQEKARSRHRQHLFRKIVWRLQTLAEGEEGSQGALELRVFLLQIFQFLGLL